MSSQKQICSICLEDNINIDKMFSVDNCNHQFCYKCMKRHIEVRLLEGSPMICPHIGCKIRLDNVSCVNFLTPKLKKLWEQRIKEGMIPVTKRFYCPNPRCSALMFSKDKSTHQETGVRECCVECSQPFCINCKVSWHNNLSCDDYKKLHPNRTKNDRKLKALANKKMWRQCGKCRNMIELSQGCVSVLCRCGHSFCFLCGAESGGCTHGHKFYDLKTGLPLFPQWRFCLCCFVLVFVIIAAIIIGGITALIIHFC